jgi:16S rRNA (guanine527-N7)-methyltransferase
MGVDVIFKYFPDLKPLQKQQFEAMAGIYGSWNAKINLISRKDIDNLYVRHVLDSLSIAKVVNFVADTRIVDVGTGGGFPGIPLAIMFPEVHFQLIDSIGKKVAAVSAIAQELLLTNVTTEVARGENVKGSYDFITGRGVCNLSVFYRLTKHLLNYSGVKNGGGILYLKGTDGAKELASDGITFDEYEISDFFREEDFFVAKRVYWIR